MHRENLKKIPPLLKAIADFRKKIIEDYKKYDEVSFMLGTVWEAEQALETRLQMAKTYFKSGEEKWNSKN